MSFQRSTVGFTATATSATIVSGRVVAHHDVIVGHVPVLIEQRIADVPEVTVRLLVLHLEVGERRLAARAPVDDPLAAVDQAFVIEVRECRRGRPAARPRPS